MKVKPPKPINKQSKRPPNHSKTSLILILTIAILSPINLSKQVQYIPSDQIYNPQLCADKKMTAPFDLKGRMTYKDFNVQTRFKDAQQVETIKFGRKKISGCKGLC